MLPQTSDSLLDRTNKHTAKPDLFQKSLKQFLKTGIVINHQNSRLTLFVLAENVSIQRRFLDSPPPADLDGGDLSSLNEVVNSGERDP